MNLKKFHKFKRHKIKGARKDKWHKVKGLKIKNINVNGVKERTQIKGA